MPRKLITRRDFLAHGVGWLSAAALSGITPPFFKNRLQPISGRIHGSCVKAGHLLLNGEFPKPTRFLKHDYVIVGGGVSGLSAAWWLKKKSEEDFLLLELEKEVGGNSRSGENAVSEYPWGAHYIPIPRPDSTLLRPLFEDLGIIVGHDDLHHPLYNELYLTGEPQERIFASGYWQEGLIPKLSAQDPAHLQFKEFFSEMKILREAVGSDYRRLFSIPIDESSRDPEFRALDQISMFDYLKQKKWDSPSLIRYVDYCCRDDFGSKLTQVSAWAGIHYFASRGSNGTELPSDPGSVLTWPAGNGWIVNQLKEKLKSHIRASSLVYAVNFNETECFVDSYDLERRETTRICAKKIVFSAPRFVAARVILPLKEKIEAT